MSDSLKPKSPRKRRNRHRYRRRASGRGTAVPSESSVTPIAEASTPPPTEAYPLSTVRERRTRPKPKLDPRFVQEETEVRTSLDRRNGSCSTGSAKTDSRLHQLDQEILFFTDTLPEDVFHDAEEGPLGDITACSTIARKTISQRSSTSNETETPTHLASSYLRVGEDSESVIVPWKTQKYNTVDQRLMYYQPSATFSTVRGVLQEVCVIDAADDGGRHRDSAQLSTIPRPPPGVSAANKNRLMNRLREEEHEEWFDASGELVDFRQYIDGDARIRGLCSKTFAPFYVAPVPLAKTVEQLPMERTVKILLGILRFDAHPSFDEAVRLRLRLEGLYKQYYRVRKLNRREVLQTKLDECRAKVEAEQGTEELQDHFQRKMARRELRQLVYQEVRTERHLAHQIRELWDEMNTKQLDCGLKMVGATELQDADEEQAGSEWHERFELELRETHEEEQGIYVREKLEYKAYVRDLARLGRQADGSETGTPVRPAVMQKPKKPDTATVRKAFRVQFEDAFGKPGEPMVNIVLQRDQERSAGGGAAGKSQGGGDLLFKVKLFIDGNHVASTKARQFAHGDVRTVVDFNTSFSVKLTTKIPEAMALVLFEKNRLGLKRRLAEVFVPLPSTDDLYDEMPVPVEYQFSCGKPYKPHTYANGTIELKIGWLEAMASGGTFPSPTERRRLPRRVVLPKELVHRWFDDRALDRPADAEEPVLAETVMLNALRAQSDHRSDNEEPGERSAVPPDGEADDEDVFYFNEDLLAFCPEETIENSERLQMLSRRFNSSLRFRDAKFIPQSERELAFVSRRDAGEDGDDEETQAKIIDETLGTDPIDLQRHRGKRYLQRVYDIISNHCRVLNQDKVNNSNLLVGGDQVPSFRALSMALLELFGPRRPLKPSRRSPIVRTSVRLSEDVTHFKIVVTVVRSFGIPMRTEDYQSMVSTGRRNSNMSSSANGRFSFRTSNVRPYITVSLKDRVLRTSTADGTAPTWNEQLELALDCTTDQIRKHLHIDLYDEYLEDLLEDDRNRSTEVYQRISSRWLGQLRIPISTIYLNQRLEGTFEIKTPTILFGYDRQQQQQQQGQAVDIPEGYGVGPAGGISGGTSASLPDMRELTHVSLFISIEPLIERPTLDTGGLECVELEQVRIRIHLWYDEYRHEFPARAVVPPMVTLLGGKRICATRLLGPLPIPFAIDERAEIMIRRYVSLIPVHYSIDPCSQLGGVWLTNKEILTTMCASPKDLGVLLACFYLQLGYDVWLIFGNSVLVGDTTFVLLLDCGEYFIVDPTSGKRYNSTDTYCPLGRIYLVVGQGNVWGNIQKENRVFLTQLDVRKSSYWRALFNRFNEAPEGCVQDESFVYRAALPTNELQRAIERKLMRKIGSWRTHRKTVWNRFMSDHLRSTLASLERDTCSERTTERYADEFAQMFVSYKMQGFPVNFSYSNLSTIVSQVKGTGIHLNSETGVEFALGVYMKDYPCNVYSVWIFLMSLVPRR